MSIFLLQPLGIQTFCCHMCHVSLKLHRIQLTPRYILPADTSIIWLPALQLVARFSATKMKTSNNSLGVPHPQPPLSDSHCYTPHCLPVGAAAGQSLSHLITALKAKSNNIIALSVKDDWDLQRACSASVPVHLTGRGCRLIKGLQNMVAQQPRLSQSMAYKSTTDSARALPLTGVTS